jgi:hypothetical protein
VDSLKNKRTQYFILFAISLLTLGSQDHLINPGLDGSYFWAFSYLLQFRPEELSKITFTYGPLAFLNYPVCYGWIIIFGVLFQVVLKFVFGLGLLKLAEFLFVDRRIALLVFTLCGLTVFNGEAYLNLIMIVFLLLYGFENRIAYLFVVGLSTAIGYYYKCSIGMSGVLLQGVFLAHSAFANKKIDWKSFLKLFCIDLISWFTIGLILFRSPKTVFETLITYYQNIIIYNETSAFYNTPDSVFLLLISGIAAIAIYFVNKDQNFRLFWSMALLFLFTGFTHSVIRMDNSHYMGFLLYLVLIGFCAILFYRRVSKYSLLLFLISFFCYYGNAGGKRDYTDMMFTVPNGPKNFSSYVIQHNKHRTSCMKRSQLTLSYVNRLEGEILQEIQKGTVDFFPWDLLYVEGNKLTNWKPRPYLQSLKMSSYFDKKTADYFASAEAPDHIIWHAGSPSSFLDGIDNSYLLNNEFHSIVSLFENYRVVKTKKNILLLAKRSQKLKVKVGNFEKELEIASGTWVQIPGQDKLIGCSLSYDFNMLRGLKKTFYRDDEFYMECRTGTGAKIRKRFWPAMAKDFLWLSPYISSIDDPDRNKDIKEVRFTNTNTFTHSGKIKLQFKTFRFEGIDGKDALYRWFRGEI